MNFLKGEMNKGGKTMTMNVLGYAAQSAKDTLAPYRIMRRGPRADDVLSRSFTVAYATRIYTVSTMTGVTVFTRWCPDMKLSGAWQASGRMSLASSRVIMSVSVAWSIPASIVRPAKKDWSSIAKRSQHTPITGLIVTIKCPPSAVIRRKSLCRINLY